MQQSLYTDEEILKAWQQAEPHVQDEVLKILRICEELKKRERETAEQVRNLTGALDRAHRELDFLRSAVELQDAQLRAEIASKDCTVD